MAPRVSWTPISVEEVPLSVPQYQWLFDDLRALSLSDCGRHWSRRGKREVNRRTRKPAAARLRQVQAQRLSSFPSSPPSDFIKLDVGNREPATLDILFSHCNVPRGHFAFSHVSAEATHSRLSVNVDTNDWYQRGIPGISTSIAETALFFKRIIAWLGCTHVRTVGCSMGAYAALLFGDLLSVDQVLACDPEIRLGDELMRSWMWNPRRVFDEQHRDLSEGIRRLGLRATISTSAYDPMEAQATLTLLALGAQPVMSKFFHATVEHIDWRSVLSRPYESPRSFIDSSLTIENCPTLALEQAANLYQDACRGLALASSAKYAQAREAFESIALYDAILYCANQELTEAAAAMKRYLRFNETLREGQPEPLHDVQRRFGIADRSECERIQAYLGGLSSEGC